MGFSLKSKLNLGLTNDNVQIFAPTKLGVRARFTQSKSQLIGAICMDSQFQIFAPTKSGVYARFTQSKSRLIGAIGTTAFSRNAFSR